MRSEGSPVRTVEVVLVDAFTSTPFTGNPAAVVPDAHGLDEAAMRAVAAEMARPATAFLSPAAADGERGGLARRARLREPTPSPRDHPRGIRRIADRVVRAGLPALGPREGRSRPVSPGARAVRGRHRSLGAARPHL